MNASRFRTATLPFWLALIPIILLGFAVYVTDLTAVSMWSDEGWTAAATDHTTPREIIVEWVRPDVHPPLFFLGLRAWRIFAGDSVFELRYYTVLLSVIGVALAYRLGKALFNTRAGILAALFYALHDLVQVLTQEVRHYPQQMLLVTLTLWLYWRFWRAVVKDRARKSVLLRGGVFAVSGAALMYTHYWGGFILVGVAIHTLVTTWGRWGCFRRLAWGFVGAGLLYLPWLPVLYHQITLERPGGLPHALENSHWVYRVLLYQLVGIPEVLWLVLGIVGVMGAYAASPPRWKPSPATLLPFIVVITAPGLSILVNTQYPTLSFRALAVVVPVAIVLAAHGLAQFRRKELAVMAAFIVVFSLTSRSAKPIHRPPWPEIADFIAAHSDSTDVVLLENDTDEHTLAYYLRQTGAEVAIGYTQSTRERRPDEYAAYLDSVLAGKNGVWVSKLDWPVWETDMRVTLTRRGFAVSTPEYDYGIYDNRPILLWRLDRIPQGDPVAVFDGALRLLHAETTHVPGGVVVTLLWSPVETLSRDYTVSVKVFDAGGAVVAQRDSYPSDGAALTSAWPPDRLQFDSYFVPAEGVSPGVYRVGVTVYYLTGDDPSYVNLPVDDCPEGGDCAMIIVGDVVVE